MASLLNSIYNSESTDPNKVQAPKPKKTLLEDVFPTTTEGNATDVQLGQYGVGQSKYDTNITPENVVNLEEIRAQKQGALDKWGNGLAKAAGIFGTSFLENTAGVVIGLGDAIIDQDISKLYNNPFSQSLDEFNGYLSQNLPNYHTKAEADYNLLDKLGTANFWSDQALSGAAYMSSAVATGAGLNSLLSLGKIVRAGKIINEAELATEGWQVLDKAAKGIRIADATDFAKNAALMSYGESSIEARGIYNDTKANLIKQQTAQNGGIEPTPEQLQEIDSKARAAGNFGFATNLAITGTTNALLFPKLLTKGYSATKSGLNKIELQGEKFVAEQTPISKAVGSELIKGALEEGGQELGQLLTQKTLTDYYSKGYENRGEKAEFVNSLIYGFQQTFGTEEGLENFFLGALMGGPAGAIQARGEAAQKNANTEQVASILNDPKFKQTVKSFDNFVRATNYEKDKEEALATGNKFDYLNAEFDQNKTMVKTFLDNDAKDVLIKQYEDLKGLSEDEFKKIAGYEVNKPLPTSQVQIIDNAVKFVDNLNKTNMAVEQLFPYKQELYDTPEKYNILTENLWHYSTSIDNMNERVKSINNDVFKLASDKGVQLQGDGIAIPYQVKDNPLLNAQITQYNQDLNFAKVYKEQLIKSYDLLANPKTQQQALNDIIGTAQLKAEATNPIQQEQNSVNEQPIQTENVNTEQLLQPDNQESNLTQESNNTNSIIQNVTSERELDSILDQAEKAGQVTPELIDQINTKRQEFINPDVPNTLESVKEINPEFGKNRFRAQTIFGTVAGQDDEKKLPEQRYFRFLEHNNLPEGAKLQIVTKNNNKELFDKFFDEGAKKYEETTGIDTIYSLLVDKNGNPILSSQSGEILEKGNDSNYVYSTIRTEKSIKDTGAKNNQDAKNALIDLRANLMNQTSPNVYLPIIDKSKGIFAKSKNRNIYLMYDPTNVEIQNQNKEVITQPSNTNSRKSEQLVLSEKELEDIQDSIDNPFISPEIREELNNDLKNVKTKQDLGRLYKKICQL